MSLLLRPLGRALLGAWLAAAACPPAWAQAPGSIKWRFQAGGPVGSSPALGADGTVYFTADDGFLYAVDPAGRQKWRVSVGRSAADLRTSSPAIGDDGTVYVGGGTTDGTGQFHAVNPADGSLRWSTLGGYAVLPGGPMVYRHADNFHSPSITLDGRLVVTTRTGRVHVVAADGTLRSDLSSANASERVASVDHHGNVYICHSTVPANTGAANLVRLRDDGQASGLLTVGFTGRDACEGVVQSIANDGTLVTNTRRSPPLWGITPDGTVRWRLASSSTRSVWPGHGAATAADGTLHVLGFVRSNADDPPMAALLALDPGSGALKWSALLTGFSFGGRGSHTPAVDADGTAYLGVDQVIVAVGRDGLVRWRLGTQGMIVSSPALGPDGTLYIGSHDGHLYALHTDGKPLAPSSWPMFNADARHTGRATPRQPVAYAQPSDCLFNWAEKAYPQLFAPALSESSSLSPPYYYRYYAASQSFLGTATDGHAYYLGPVSNQQVLDLGPAAPWMALAGCRSDPLVTPAAPSSP